MPNLIHMVLLKKGSWACVSILFEQRMALLLICDVNSYLFHCWSIRVLASGQFDILVLGWNRPITVTNFCSWGNELSLCHGIFLAKNFKYLFKSMFLCNLQKQGLEELERSSHLYTMQLPVSIWNETLAGYLHYKHRSSRTIITS